jgi:hypothetical protein
MNQPSGFVPIPFRGVGKLLISLGCAGLILYVLLKLTAWLPVTWTLPAMGLVLIGIGLYLLVVVPVQD